MGPRIRLLTLGGDEPATSFGANCVAVRGTRGTLLVDPLIAPAHAQLVADALDRAGFPAVIAVALTHHHTDHALGAGLFAARGAPVFAQRRCAQEMAAQHPAILAERRRDPALSELFRGAEPHVPARIFDDRVSIELGDLEVDVLHLGHGHTAGDAVVVVPAEGVAVAGDLLFHGYHFNYEEADRRGVRASLAALSPLAERFIPGHGEPGGREILAAQALYHDEAERIACDDQRPADAEAALRERFPGRLLNAAVPGAVRFWRGRAEAG